MIVAQISDLHLAPPGHRLLGRIDSYGMAVAAIDHLRVLLPRPEVVLVTGDIVAQAEPDIYRQARELLDGLEAPYLVIPGNHDRRGELVAAFAGHAWMNDGYVQYTVDDYEMLLIGVDTLDEGHETGRLSDERLAWLDATLSANSTRTTLIFMHHPPFPSGIWWMDSAGLAGAGAFRTLVEEHSQVRLIACGHVHRPIATSFGGARVVVAPSTSFQVDLDLVPERPPRLIMEPPACYLHVFDGGEFVTHTSYVGAASEQIDVGAYIRDWEAVRSGWRARKAALGYGLSSG